MRAITGIDPPQRDAEQLRRGTVARRFHRGGEVELDLISARRRHAVAEDFTEERMRERNVHPIAPPAITPARGDEAAPLQPGREVCDTERTQTVDRERLTDRDELERGPFVVVQAAHARRDQVVQALTRLEWTRPMPQPTSVPQRARLETVEHQLPQKQRIAVARLPQEVQRGALDGAGERGGDNGFDLGARRGSAAR